MLKNLLKVAFRNIRKEKFFSLLNILGLAIGSCCVLLISLYINDELSFDKFHLKADRIYRINQTFIWGEDDNLFGSTGPAVAEALKTEIPEFEEVTRIHTPGSMTVSYENKRPYVVFDENAILAVDDNFFDVFTFPVVDGDIKTMLEQPYSIVLTEETGRKYFGEDTAVGKMLFIGEREKRRAYSVTGIVRDVPGNSHVEFDMLISMNSIPRVAESNWSWIWTTFVTFAVLDENADPETINLAGRLEDVPRKHAGVSLKRLQNITFEEYEADGKEWKLYAQPLTDIHLKSDNVYSRLNTVSDVKMVYIFGTIGLLIFIICLINFVNLTTARSINRAKEIGVRKVVGSSRAGLIFQFLAESVLISTMAIILGAILADAFMPAFNSLSGKEISFDLINQPTLLIALIAFPFVTGLLAGLYPALVMTSYNIVKSLKGKVTETGAKGNLRNALVVLQFTVSTVFIASTITVYNQLQYQKSLDLGFDKDNKLIINRVDRLDVSMESYRDMISENRHVESVTISDATPPYLYNFDNFSLKGSGKSEFPLNYLIADEKFADTYGMKLISGRDFRKGANEANRGLVNESTVRFLGISDNEDILGRKLNYYGNEMEVIGVIADFNVSFNSQIRPFAVFGEDSDLFSSSSRYLTISMKENLTAEDTEEFVRQVEKSWDALNVDTSIDYTFLDHKYEDIYRPTILFGQILSVFSVLTVLIAVLGIIGLITYMVEKRSKEIGVRKVLGASVYQVFMLLSGRLGFLLIISFVIAVPLVWYGMEVWLQDFDKRKPIAPADLILAGVIMFVITLLASGVQTVKAAMANPVQSLSDE